MKKPKAMTADEYKALKTRLGASYSAIADEVGRTPRTVMRWARVGLQGPAVKLLKRMDRKAGKK